MARLFQAKAKRTLPTIIMTKQKELVVTLDESVNGTGPMTLEPHELFGFGLGEFTVEETNGVDAGQAQQSAMCCLIQNPCHGLHV